MSNIIKQLLKNLINHHMIIGIGVDIVQIPRIEILLDKYGERLLRRVLTSKENNNIGHFSNKKLAKFVAKRYAAKEAISKAFGSGIGELIQFRNVEIENDKLGKPVVRLLSPTNITNNYKIDLSISDDYPVAIAFAVVSDSQ